MIHGPCSRLIGCTIHTPTRARFGERVYKMDCKVTKKTAHNQRFSGFFDDFYFWSRLFLRFRVFPDFPEIPDFPDFPGFLDFPGFPEISQASALFRIGVLHVDIDGAAVVARLVEAAGSAEIRKARVLRHMDVVAIAIGQYAGVKARSKTEIHVCAVDDKAFAASVASLPWCEVLTIAPVRHSGKLRGHPQDVAVDIDAVEAVTGLAGVGERRAAGIVDVVAVVVGENTGIHRRCVAEVDIAAGEGHFLCICIDTEEAQRKNERECFH